MNYRGLIQFEFPTKQINHKDLLELIIHRRFNFKINEIFKAIITKKLIESLGFFDKVRF